MTQHELNRAVARATGENLRVISRLGFTLADPVFIESEPEPMEAEDMIVNSDAVDAERCLAAT